MTTGLQGCRILIVEDEYYLADDVKRALSKLGAEILGPVPTRHDAFALIERERHLDAAVLDVKLRDEVVLEVAEALRRRNIPFLFATGYDQAALPNAFQDVIRLEKPFTTQGLITILQDLLNRS